MYIVGNKKITLEEAQALANEFNTTVEALAAAGEWKLDEGKPSDPPKKTPTTDQNQTAAGDSSLADTSLGSPQIELYPILNFQQEDGVTAFDEEDIDQDAPIIPFTEKQKRFDQNQNEWADYNISRQSELDRAQAADATFVTPIDIYEPNTTGIKGGTEDDIYNVGWYGGTKTSTSDDIKMAIQDEKLELEEKSAYQINDIGLKAEFVKKYYDANLLRELGVNINDFEGWLIENNLSQDFENDIKNGLYKTSGFDANYAYADGQSTAEEMQALFEYTLRNFLDAYLSEDQDRASKRDFVEKYNKNNDFYKGAVGFDDAYNKYLEASKGGVKGLYNWEGLGAYREQAFSTISKRDKAVAEKQAEEYRRRKAATGLQELDNTAADFLESLGDGFKDAGLESIRFIETKLFNTLGIDDTWVKRDRLLNDFAKDWDVKTGLQYMSASGKKVKINDTNYIVDSDNQIYDVDEGIRVTNILSPLEANTIISAAKKTSETDTDISYRGGLVTAGNVVGNIGWQVLATRGLSLSRAAASEKYIASANGFKNTKDLKKYMTAVNKSGNRRGMNWKGIDKSTVHSFGVKMPFNPMVVDATLFQTFYGAASGYESTIIAAKDAGLSNAEAESLADMASEQMAVLYGLTGPINPRIKALNNLDDFLTSSSVVKKAVADYLKAGKNPGAFKEALAAEIGKVAKTAKNFLEEGSKEVVQENIQQMGENLVVNKNINKIAGADILKAEYSVKDFMETSVLSFVTAGAMGSVNLSNIGYTPTNKKRIANLYKMGSDIKGSKQRLQEMVKAGKITEQQSFDILQQATAVHEQANRIPEWMVKSDVDVVQVAMLLQEIQNSENLKKRIDSSMHGPIDQSIAEAKQKIEAITQEAAKIQITKEAAAVTKIAGQENVTVYNTVEEMKAAGIDEGALDADGLTEKDGKIIINLEVAAKTKAVSVSSHELLHRILRSELKNNKAMPKIINEFRNILKSKGVLEAVEKRMKAGIADGTYNIIFNEDGTVSGGDIDEYLTFFSDAIALEKIPFSALEESQWVRIGRLIIDALRTRFGTVDKEFKNGQQVFNFIRDYQKSIQKGKLTSLAKAKAKSSEGVEVDVKKSMSASAERAKEALDQMQEEGYDPNNFELYDILNGMAGAQLNKYKIKGLQITDMEEAVADVVGRLYTERDVNKFDGRGSLYGYLNGRIKFRILDAFKANPIWVEDFGEVDAEGLTGKEVQKVAVEAAETTETTQEAPKYRSLLDAKTVSPEGVKTATEKVMSTVRVMKKRMDESVSKNVTVKPYIAELKKDFGKQLDIILKKEMGGVKDRQLEKWLLKNKKAILENMTTTWLMTAMPNAIQKKVNGQWTSDWKGKKIDRETVSTDNAGRTSGAELARRLPKASLKMSDADFLSNFFDEKGKLIRGRKESLAKAIGEEVGFEIFNQALQDETSPIRQAFEQRQDLLQAQLGNAFVQEVARDVERGNVKYSITAKQANELRQHEGPLISYLEKVGGITESRLRSALFKIYLEENETSLTEEQLRKIAKDGAVTVAKYFKKREDIGEADFIGFVMNGMQQLEASTNLLEAANVTLDDIFGSYRNMMDVPSVQLERRAVELDFNIQLVEKEGLNGLIKILKWMGGHNHTSSKIGKGRGQYYASKDDYYKNNIALIPGVTVSGAKVFYKGEEVKFKPTPSQKAYKTVDKKKVPKTKEDFANEYDERKEQAQEAWDLLNNFLAFVHAQNNPVLWVATMKSLDSNMQSILKAAANVEYYFVGETDSEIRYEHIIPTNYVMLQLTDYYWNRKSRVDLNALRDAYSVALIPTDMDENINLQYQSVMPLRFDPMKDSPIERYYNMTTFGMNYMRALEKIGGKNKGKVYGEKWVKFSQSAVEDANSKLNTAIEESTESAKFSKSTPRAVFMVGGPGAGKTNVGKGLKLGRRGYKVINQDIAVEALKEEANLPAREGEYTAEQRSLRSKIGAAARKAAQEKMEKYTNNRESMVVDGTGASFNATMKKIKALEDAGYEVHLVFANTSLEEAIARNEARAERSLPEFVVKKSWQQVQESAAKYKEIYGERFYEVNTNELKIGEDLPKPLLDKLYKNLEVGPAKYSKTINKEFNEILERKTGIGAEKVFSKVQAELRGASKGRFKFFVAPGADDFRGLVHYAFAGKGKQGEADMAWFEEKLMDPYFKGVEAINRVRQQIKRDFKETVKTFRKEYKMLSKKIGDTGFTYDQALRVYMWNRQGTQVPGLSKRDTKLLLDAISKNPELVALADALLVVSRRTEWMEPGDYWQTQTVLSDLNGMTEKIGRKKYLAEFIENADIIFSEENLNKIEAIKGRAHREALEDALYAMRNGSNRPSGSNKQVNAFINWINGSTGAIMFFNRRSALLQMLSFTNFINWSDNNPVKAAAAFANQKQYWADWAMIFNSDKLKERRSGLKTDVSEAELANAANRSKGDPRAILAYLLKIGFTPTQIADSMAIATGGATFYRNRINKYIKEGMSVKDAEAQAWIDFTKKSDEAQQSSDPALVSQLQRSVLGRLVFAFANTPMQYTRLMKKAAMDLAAGRGSFTENISKIAYYGFVQNFIFASLQSALFALIPGFDDEDEGLDDKEAEKLATKEEAKIARVLNSMIDTIVRGSGVYGAVGVTIKNTILEYLKQEDKGFLADHTYTILSATSISPPINSKLRKIYSATQTKKFERDELEVRPWAVATKGRPNFGPGWSIVGNLVSGALNVPLDRVVDELNSIGEAMDKRNTTWQRIALALGWKTWDVNAVDEEGDLIKATGKAKRKKEGIEKAKETRKRNSAKKQPPKDISDF